MKTLLFIIAVATLTTSDSQAIITVTTQGVTENFGTFPDVSNWSTAPSSLVAVYGATGDSGSDRAMAYNIEADIDAAVNTLSASQINSSLGTTSQAINNLSTNQTALWNDGSNSTLGAGGFLQTRPTSTRMTVFMASLQNGSGSLANGLDLGFVMTVRGAVNPGPPNPNEQVFGWRVLYSLSGTPNSWLPVDDLNGLGSIGANESGTRSATLDFTAAGGWAPDAPLWIMWADENASNGTGDNGLLLDGIEFTALPAPVPEPSSTLLLAASIGVLSFRRRRS